MRNFIIGSILVIIILSIGGTMIYRSTADLVDIQVTDKEVKVQSSGESTTSNYLVFTEGEVFENTDSWPFFKFNSSDIQGELKVGNTYRAKVAGWRVPFLSMYRNVIEIENGSNLK